jgi:hypothetical protein
VTVNDLILYLFAALVGGFALLLLFSPLHDQPHPDETREEAEK